MMNSIRNADREWWWCVVVRVPDMLLAVSGVTSSGDK